MLPTAARAGDCANDASPNLCDADPGAETPGDYICTATSTTITCHLDHLDAGELTVAYAVLNTDTNEYNVFGIEGGGGDFCCVFSASGRTMLNLYGTDYADDLSFVYLSYQLDAYNANFQGRAFGKAGDDEISGSESEGGTYTYTDDLHGDAGDDEVYGLAGNDVMTGDDGEDYLEGGSDQDTIHGGDDPDTIHGDDGADGEDGQDHLYGDGGADTIHGGDGGDRIWGGQGNDKLHGAEHDDIIYGEGDNDDLTGGPGADTLFGGAGEDDFNGGTGDDYISGDDGIDHMCGDEPTGEDYADMMDGGGGDDIGWGFTATECESGDAGNGGAHVTEDLYEQCSWANYTNVEDVTSTRPSSCPSTP